MVLLGVLLYALLRRRDDSPDGELALLGGGETLLSRLGAAVSSSTWQLPAAGDPYREAIEAAEIAYAIPRNQLARQLDIESDHFNPDVIAGRRLSRSGAIGIGQFMPATAAERGLDPTDPFASIDAAAAYMRELYDKFGTWEAALAAYNWGQGNVARKGLSAAPAETRTYVATILEAVA